MEGHFGKGVLLTVTKKGLLIYSFHFRLYE